MIDVLLIDPMVHGMVGQGTVLDLVVQNYNGHPLAVLIILLGGGWHPLLLLLWRHNLDLLRSSPDTIYGHMRHDRLVLGTDDIPKLVGLHPHQRLVWLGQKEVDLLGHLDQLWYIQLAWLVL